MFKTDLEAFLNDQGVVNFVSVALAITVEEYKKLSDFEKFTQICDHSDAFQGSSLIKRFLMLIHSLSGEEPTLNTLNYRHEQIRTWRVIHGDKTATYNVLNEQKNTCVDYYRYCDIRESFDIVEYILRAPHMLPQTLEGFIESLDMLQVDKFLINAEDFKYSRPDEYHSNEIYQKLRRDKKYKKEELGMLVSHIICVAGKNKKCELHIMLENKIDDAVSLCELFEKRGANVEIFLKLDLLSCSVFDKIFDIMLKKSKKISSEIIIPEDADVDAVRKRISELLDTIPFSRTVWQKDYSAYINEL